MDRDDVELFQLILYKALIQNLKVSGDNESEYIGCAGISRLSNKPKQISAKAIRVVKQIAKNFGCNVALMDQTQTDIPYEDGDAILADSIVIHVYDDDGTDILNVYILSHEILRLMKGCFICFEIETGTSFAD